MKFIKKLLVFLVVVALTMIITILLIVNLKPLIFSKTSSTKSDTVTEKNLINAWTDIKKTFNIDEEKYYKISFEEINLLRTGTYTKIKNPEISKEISKVLDEIYQQFEESDLKCTEPQVLINKNLNEIMFTYKEINGMNTMINAKYIDNKWEKTKEAVQGKKNLDLSNYPSSEE